MNYWNKFYECDCHTEGIMMSYEDDEFATIDLAFFNQSLKLTKQLTFKERIRWCWYILRKGIPWNDMVTLSKKTAKELGRDLLKFSNRKIT